MSPIEIALIYSCIAGIIMCWWAICALWDRPRKKPVHTWKAPSSLENFKLQLKRTETTEELMPDEKEPELKLLEDCGSGGPVPYKPKPKEMYNERYIVSETVEESYCNARRGRTITRTTVEFVPDRPAPSPEAQCVLMMERDGYRHVYNRKRHEHVLFNPRGEMLRVNAYTADAYPDYVVRHVELRGFRW
jgi:hypothetical protein